MKFIMNTFSYLAKAIAILTFLTSMVNTKPANLFNDILLTDENGIVSTLELASLNKGNFMYFPKSMLSSEKRLPVIVWANGTVCAPILYQEFLKQVAAAGYIVVTNTELFAGNGKEQKASIDFIISKDSDPESPFYHKVDTTRIGVMGHSQGGKSSVNCANIDERVKCVFSVAGSSNLFMTSKLKVPSFFVTGNKDYVVLSDLFVKPSFNSAGGPAVYGNVKDAIHTTINFKPSIYSKYAIKWFDIYLKHGSMEDFKSELLKDSEWSDIKFKNL